MWLCHSHIRYHFLLNFGVGSFHSSLILDWQHIVLLSVLLLDLHVTQNQFVYIDQLVFLNLRGRMNLCSPHKE